MQRFWDKVDKSGDCWLWTASKTHQGYGYFRFDGTMRKAHRMSWLLANGEIPDEMFVCHTCDNPSCVNPEHLWLGNNQDNMDDMNIKSRHAMTKRTHCPKGHEYDEQNTRKYTNPITGQFMRACRKCDSVRKQKIRAKAVN
jgi:hypothetical protein